MREWLFVHAVGESTRRLCVYGSLFIERGVPSQYGVLSGAGCGQQGVCTDWRSLCGRPTHVLWEVLSGFVQYVLVYCDLFFGKRLSRRLDVSSRDAEWAIGAELLAELAVKRRSKQNRCLRNRSL